MNRTIDRIREELELEGFDPAAPNWDRVFVARKVQKCQEMQGVRECPSCRAFQECALARQHLMYTKFGDQR